ncbi:AsmA family protein [bacterium]|nr:MAG: AsmA family protein [bacterium]
MKKLLIVFGILIGLVVVAAIGAGFYFNDAKLREIILPIAEEQLGRPVQIETLSLSLFNSFPNATLSLSQVAIPDDSEKNNLIKIDEVQVSIHLMPLLDKQLEIAQLTAKAPEILYSVDAKGKTNIDKLLQQFSSESPTTESSSDTSSASFAIQIEAFQIEHAKIDYNDAQSGYKVLIAETDISLSASLNEKIESKTSIQIGALSARDKQTVYVNNLKLGLTQESIFDAKNGTLQLTKGNLEIEGLSLGIQGEITHLNDTEPELNIELNSSAPNLNNLLKLIPEAYTADIKGIETKGNLTLKAALIGKIKSGEIPHFEATVAINDGFVKYPGYEAITDIQVDFTANNERVNLSQLKAKAGINSVSVSGSLNDILKESITYSLKSSISADLSTIKNYYDIKQFDIADLRGKLTVQATAKGKSTELEKTDYSAQVQLDNGFIRYQYPGVTKPIENIKVRVTANPKRVTISELQAQAAGNLLTATGTLDNPLSEANRIINSTADIRLNLGTIKEFYPLNPDSIQLAGMLTGKIQARGNIAYPEKLAITSSVKLSNGAVKMAILPQPIQNITIEASGNQNQITLSSASFKTKSNQLTLKGVITNYLKEVPSYKMNMSGTVYLNELQDFTGKIEGLKNISGTAITNLDLSGKGLDFDIQKIAYSGSVQLNKFSVTHDSLPQPINQIDVQLVFSDKTVQLKNLYVWSASTKFNLTGDLNNYKIFIDEKQKGTASLNGSFNAKMIQVDEWMDWDSETEDRTEPLLLELPAIVAKLNAQAESLVVMGVPMQQLKADAQLNSKEVRLNSAKVDVFGGSIDGNMVFSILRPTRSKIDFKGNINNVRAESFFKEYKITGKDSKLDQYVSGGLQINASYLSEIDSLMSPDLKTSNGTGTFGMTKSRIKNHPIQLEVANLSGIKELSNIALDNWTANYVIKNGLMTISNMKLTSGNIGAELNGTYDLVNDKMNFAMSLFLPKSYNTQLAKWITKDGVDALTNKNGTVIIPIKLTGSSEKPQVKTDTDAIKKMVTEYLKKKAGDAVEGALKNLFGN